MPSDPIASQYTDDNGVKSMQKVYKLQACFIFQKIKHYIKSSKVQIII